MGGGESWTSGIVPDTSETGRPADTISEALGRRESQKTATGGLDYDILDTAVEMQVGLQPLRERPYDEFLRYDVFTTTSNVTTVGGKKGFHTDPMNL